MGRTWFAAGLLVSILLGCILLKNIVVAHTDTTSNLITQVSAYADAENYIDASQCCDEAIFYWQTHTRLLSSFLRHEDSGAVEIGLQQLKSFTETGQRESILACCAELLAQMEHIQDNERALLYNIL